MTDDEYLLHAGMPIIEVQNMDPDIKHVIATDLQQQNLPYKYIETREIGKPYYTRLAAGLPNGLSGIRFYASSFKSGNNISIYPTYEFTDYKQPEGKDTFSIYFADAVRPNTYGGQIWHKDQYMNDWRTTSSSKMIPTEVSLQGANFSGQQLGNPDWKMKIKGCAWVHATVGDRNDKRIVVNYVYNPNKMNYSVSFNLGKFGFSIDPPEKVYSTGTALSLSY
ncbi:hypothetical protein [Bifidobacterium hapali]|nr:hypothetical protein [Bifidobacterium hapali]